MKIVESCKARAVIFAETETFAAQEFQRYIRAISGVTLAMPQEPPGAGQQAVIVGPTRAFPAYSDKLDDHAYLVRTEGPRLFLTGRNRLTTLHSVFTFLEEHLGCGWCGLGAEGETLPRRSTIEVKRLHRRYRPDLTFRGMSDTDIWHNAWYLKDCPHQDRDGAKTVRMLDWMVRNRMNTAILSIGMFRDRQAFFLREAREKRGLRLCVGMHDLYFWFSADRYRKSHPEYFARHAVSGKRDSHQLCLSHPAVARIVARNIIGFLDRNPHPDVLGLGQVDGAGWCTCRRCLTMEGGEHYGFAMGKVKGMHLLPKVYLAFCNRVVEQVAKKHPHQRFFALCYGTSVEPPLDPDFRTHPNLDLNVAMFRRLDRPLAQGYSSEEDVCMTRMEKAWYTEFPGMLKAWRRTARGAIFSHMYHMGRHDNLAKPIYLSVPQDMALYARLGLQGYYSQAASESFEIYGLTYYIAARSAFDTRRNAKDLIGQYCRAYYGKAARVMTRYFDELGNALGALPDKVKAECPKLLHALGEPPEIVFNAAALLAVKPDLADKSAALLTEALRCPVTGRERRRIRAQRTVLDYTVKMGELVALSESARITFKQARFRAGARIVKTLEMKLDNVRTYVARHMRPEEGLSDMLSPDNIVKNSLHLGWGREFYKRPEACFPDTPHARSDRHVSRL